MALAKPCLWGGWPTIARPFYWMSPGRETSRGALIPATRRRKNGRDDIVKRGLIRRRDGALGWFPGARGGSKPAKNPGGRQRQSLKVLSKSIRRPRVLYCPWQGILLPLMRGSPCWCSTRTVKKIVEYRNTRWNLNGIPESHRLRWVHRLPESRTSDQNRSWRALVQI